MAGMVQVPYGHATVSRIEPELPAHAFKTYGMSMPLRSHWRPATCDEFECDAYQYGWVSTFDLATELGAKQYAYCRQDKTRSFSAQRHGTTLIKLVYKPGNRCFRSADHRMPLARLPRFYVAGGDWRGNPMGVPARVHQRADDWVDDFANHQDTIATAIRKG